jgi:hypothetical protein
MSNTNGNSSETAIHLSLQGKGGVGKSLLASILAQYFSDRRRTVRCMDTDPVNRTLSQYRALQVERIQLVEDGNRINQRGFDVLMERFLTESGVTFVVDNGASTFLPLWHYMLENNALGLLRDEGRQVYVHTVVTGGQALTDTLNGFAALAKTAQDQSIIVWVNEYFGRVEAEGKPFHEMAAYRDNSGKVAGSISVMRRNPDTFGRDLEEMVSRKLTFEEALAMPEFSLMSRQRLRVVQRDLFEQLDALSL